MAANFRPDALSRLADALSEDVLNTPAEQLLAEAAEDNQSPRALISEFETVLRRSARRAGRLRLMERLRRIGHAFPWPVATMATAPIVAVAIAFVVGAHYFDGSFRSAEPIRPAKFAAYENSKQLPVAVEGPSAAPQVAGAAPAPAPHLPQSQANIELERALTAYQQQATLALPPRIGRTTAPDATDHAPDTAAPSPRVNEEADVASQVATANMLANSATPGDHAQAFYIFKRIAEEHWNDQANSPHAHEIAEGIVALAKLYLSGSPVAASSSEVSENSQSRISSPIAGAAPAPADAAGQNPREASVLLEHAATHFGNSDAEYELGRLYRDGTGVAKDLEAAARWFNAAAIQGQYGAQASLGVMLVEGQGVPRDVARGLSWLTLANNAAGQNEAWIKEAYATAYAHASASDVKVAQSYTDDWSQRHSK